MRLTGRNRVLVFGWMLGWVLVSPSRVRGDEYIRTTEELTREGFSPVRATESKVPQNRPEWNYPEHSLAWPVAFANREETVANSMAQFQPFSDPPYFHGGVDIRTSTRAEVRAPVAGWLEAGHYGYTTNPDGSLTKHWKPWPETGNATYFEIALVSQDGVRFEFHHINRERLPGDMVTRLNAGRSWVEAGTHLGYAVFFSFDYTHIHYNIILPDGTRVNPEMASPLMADQRPPRVQASFAVLPSGKAVTLEGPFPERPSEFVIATIDTLDQGPYQHSPASTQLIFEGKRTDEGEVVAAEWNFRRFLLDSKGFFPMLSEVFKDEILTPTGRTLRTTGGYGTGTSLIRLKIPPNVHGPFRIELKDVAGNLTVVRGRL